MRIPVRGLRRAAAVGLLALGGVVPTAVRAQELATSDRGAVALGELIAGLGTSARVLMIGAHPDDEDTQLVAFLARGRHVETAYLSLTRGDGGQNLIGNELGEGLGVIRTEELLAARRIDGAQQFFTRAYDFGFSKSAEETYKHWPKDSILRDVVTVVRGFKPHIIVAVFSGTPRDGHGHHQVSGILAREAYDLAGDTVRFPTRTTNGLGPWTVTHFYRGQRGNAPNATYAMNVGEYSPLLGRSYAEIAGESRSQHKSQGFGVLQRKGVQMDYVRREASRLRSTADVQPLFEGIDTTFARFRGAFAGPGRARLDSLLASVAEARRAYNAFDATAAVAPLAAVIRHLDVLCPPPIPGADRPLAPMDSVAQRMQCGVPATSAAVPAAADLARSATAMRQRASLALALAAGVAAEATASREQWPSGGGQVPVAIRVYNRGAVSVEFIRASVLFPGVGTDLVDGASPLVANRVTSRAMIAPDSALSVAGAGYPVRPMAPWWLATPRIGDIFSTRINGLPEHSNLRSGIAYVALQIAGAQVQLSTPIVYRYADPVRGEVERPVVFVPAVTVMLDRAVELATSGATYDRVVPVRVRSYLDETWPVRVELSLPAGLTADSAARTVSLPPGGTELVTFRVRGRAAAGAHQIVARANVGRTMSRTDFDVIEYPHIRPQRMYRPSTIALRVADVTVPSGLRITYVPGVSDNVAPVLQQLGFALGIVQPAALDTFDLSATDVIVVGPRAYDAHVELVRNNPKLLAWVQRGGTMVVQYGQFEMMNPGIMPFQVTINRQQDRVTEEDAPVRVLDPTSPLLSTPNRITPQDFEGWVQERALYMPRTFADAYKPLLSMNDPGEPANDAAILVAAYGSGTYVYTTLSFFRQLPAGVPGPTKLFVNLLAAGQKGRPIVP
jgi:LmbE family N-acetylglucosaminyl deacetylase